MGEFVICVCVCVCVCDWQEAEECLRDVVVTRKMKSQDGNLSRDSKTTSPQSSGSCVDHSFSVDSVRAWLEAGMSLGGCGLTGGGYVTGRVWVWLGWRYVTGKVWLG